MAPGRPEPAARPRGRGPGGTAPADRTLRHGPGAEAPVARPRPGGVYRIKSGSKPHYSIYFLGKKKDYKIRQNRRRWPFWPSPRRLAQTAGTRPPEGQVPTGWASRLPQGHGISKPTHAQTAHAKLKGANAHERNMRQMRKRMQREAHALIMRKIIAVSWPKMLSGKLLRSLS